MIAGVERARKEYGSERTWKLFRRNLSLDFMIWLSRYGSIRKRERIRGTSIPIEKLPDLVRDQGVVILGSIGTSKASAITGFLPQGHHPAKDSFLTGIIPQRRRIQSRSCRFRGSGSTGDARLQKQTGASWCCPGHREQHGMHSPCRQE